MEWFLGILELLRLYNPGDEPWQVFGRAFTYVIVGLIAWVAVEITFGRIDNIERDE